MKENPLALTSNVKEGYYLVNKLQARPRTEMVGLGLIYGNAGLGKSRFAYKYCLEHEDSIYFRLDQSMSLKSFLEQLFKLLCRFYDVPVIRFRRTTAGYFEQVLNFLQHNPDIMIFIDEIDYAFKNIKLLATIRDLVDKSCATIILIGMQTAKQSLLACNAHYFDRCNYFAEFKPIEQEDAVVIVESLSEFTFDIEVIENMRKESKGTIRQLVKRLAAYEKIATENDLKHLGKELIVNKKKRAKNNTTRLNKGLTA